MRNGKKKKKKKHTHTHTHTHTQNDAPFVAFYDMCAVTFVLPDEMKDLSITGLQWFILIPRLNYMGSHRFGERV